MSEEELSSVWRDLLSGDIDILVCTTIIETGVDVPNCNTLLLKMQTEWVLPSFTK